MVLLPQLPGSAFPPWQNARPCPYSWSQNPISGALNHMVEREGLLQRAYMELLGNQTPDLVSQDEAGAGSHLKHQWVLVCAHTCAGMHGISPLCVHGKYVRPHGMWLAFVAARDQRNCPKFQ